MVVPASAFAGTVAPAILRSGPTEMTDDTAVLLPSLLSGLTLSASATAITRYFPAMPVGRVKGVVAVLSAREASSGTCRLPRGMSPGDRENLVVEVPTGGEPRVLATSVS